MSDNKLGLEDAQIEAIKLVILNMEQNETNYTKGNKPDSSIITDLVGFHVSAKIRNEVYQQLLDDGIITPFEIEPKSSDKPLSNKTLKNVSGSTISFLDGTLVKTGDVVPKHILENEPTISEYNRAIELKLIK